MASNHDDFDDFFDTGDPKADGPSKVDQSGRKASVSSERRRSTDYSSDSMTSRDDDDDGGRQKNKSRPRSDSPRGRDSSFSDDSMSRSPPGRSGNRHRQSRSPSSGTDISLSRTASSDSVTGRDEDKDARFNMKVKVPSEGRDNSSLSADSDNENDEAKQQSTDATRGQAWSNNNKSRKSERSSKGDRSEDSDASSSADRQKTTQRRRKVRRDSLSHTDSDITDVSPISSPRQQKRHSSKKRESKPPVHSYARGAPGVRNGEDSRTRDKKDNKKSNLDLNLLMDAVSELEKKQKQSRVQANTRTVMFEPGGGGQIRRERKSNYTFSDSDTNRIDQENQRLMRQIMCRMHAVDGRYTGQAAGKGRKKTLTVPATSGINRMKDHHRIEMENLALLKRIQRIRPTKGISKQEQLSAYHTTLLHGVPISTLQCPAPAPALDLDLDPSSPSEHPHRKTSSSRSRSRSRPSSSKSTGSQLGRTHSLLSLQSAGRATTSASSFRSGHSGQSGQSLRSLRSRPSSAKSSVRERPAWDDRW